MKERLIASFLAALMLATPVALAATALQSYPAVLTTDSTLAETSNSLDAYVVVGSGGTSPAGLASDIAGAINLALRLTEMSYTKITITGAVTGEYDGLVRDGIDLCTIDTSTTANNCNLTKAVSGGTGFPNLIKNTHYTSLREGKISWRSSTYDYAEQVDATGVVMRHKLAAANINGTEKMVIGDNDIKYEYVFKKQIQGLGTPGTPNYSYPVGIELLGEPFTIVGVDTDSILMLSGSTCSGVSATSGCTYGDYTAYATQGGTTFVSLEIQDADGNTVDTLLVTGWTSGASVTKTSTATGLDLTVTAIAALQDGTVVGCDIVVGPTGTTTHDYDATADVESTGTANEAFDITNHPRWGIQFSAGGSTAGTIASSAKIQVVYKPSAIDYYLAGEKLSLPNDYGDLGFEGWNIDDFATITVKQAGPLAVYNETDAELQESYLYGIEISSDTSGVLYGGNDFYTKAYVLFNATNDAALRKYPVAIGWYDTTKGKILVSNSFRTGTGISGNGAVSTGTQYAYAMLNSTESAVGNMFSYAFVINNGEKSFYVNVSINANRTQPIAMWAGDSQTSTSIDLGFKNATTWNYGPNKFEQAFIKLGSTTSVGEAIELNVTTEAGTVNDRNAGTRSRELVDDTGLLVQNPATNTGSDAVVFKVPSKLLAVKAYFGKKGAGTVTTGDTVDQIAPITTPIALLDSEVTSTHKAKNLVTVGGSCINSVTADAMGLTYPACGATSTIPEDKAIIEVIDDIFTTGKSVVVVAGWSAADTRRAAEVLMKYDTLLTDITASKVEVTAATTAGITPV